MSFFKANKILTTVFFSLDDKILNILELHEQLSTSKNLDLVEASIAQKIDVLKDIQFRDGVKFSSLKPILFSFLSITSMFILLLLLKPEVLINSSERVVNYNNHYVPQKDFKLSYISNNNIYRNSDFSFTVSLQGKNFPQEIYLNVGPSDILLEKLNDSTFHYLFSNVNHSFSFNLFFDDHRSEAIQVNIIDLPTIDNFQLKLTYPKYTKIEDAVMEGIFDVSVPEGTQIQYVMSMSYTDSAYIYLDQNRFNFIEKDHKFIYSHRFYENTSYSIKMLNKSVDSVFLVDKVINIIKDTYPIIYFDSIKDENEFELFHFKINIEDQYGFTNLFFHVNHDSIPIPYNSNLSKQVCYFSYDFSAIKDSTTSYFFSVYDNDKINGFKKTMSSNATYVKETFQNSLRREKGEQEKLNQKIKESQDLVDAISKELQSFQESLLTENMDAWERNEKIKSIQKKQEELESVLRDLNNNNLDQSNLSEEVKRKHDLLAENIQNLMDEDLKKLLEEFQKLADEFNKNNIHELSKQLELNYDQLSKELDKNLEKLSKYEIQKNIELLSEELKQLSESELSAQDSLYSSELNFDFIKSEYDSLLSKNNNLDNKLPLDSLSKEFSEIEKSYSESEDKEREKRAEKMEELSEKMSSMLSESNSSQEGENADNLRLLLDNLFYFSFEQENIINEYKGISSTNPKYIALQKRELRLKNDYSIIQDSLYQLSLRSDFIGHTISENANGISSKLEFVLSDMESRRRQQVLVNQQHILSHSNELILLLSESLKNMDQASGSGSGKQSKKKQKPKSGEPSLSDLRKSQEGMKEELEKMIQQMENGQKPGSKSGKQQMGQMLMQQEMFQKQLSDILSNDGISDDLSKKLNEIKRLSELNKSDLVNMKISNNFYNRQQQILTRLLEAENADLEREKDKKREAQENFEYKVSDSKKYFEQYNEKTNFNEIIKLDEIQLNQFYKELFNGYLNKINAN